MTVLEPKTLMERLAGAISTLDVHEYMHDWECREDDVIPARVTQMVWPLAEAVSAGAAPGRVDEDGLVEALLQEEIFENTSVTLDPVKMRDSLKAYLLRKVEQGDLPTSWLGVPTTWKDPQAERFKVPPANQSDYENHLDAEGNLILVDAHLRPLTEAEAEQIAELTFPA